MNSSSSNSSSSSMMFPIPPECRNDTFRTVAQFIVAMTMVLVIISNVLTLLVTWRAMSTRINPYFFVSLAMSDLLTGIFVLPFHLRLGVDPDAGDPSPLACTFSGVMFHILQSVSLFSFFALSLDRLLSIHFPYHYHEMLTAKVNMAILFAIWLIPIALYGAIPATGIGIYVYKCWQSMCNLGPVDMNYLTFMMLLSVVVFLATYAINGRIFYIARQQRVKIACMEQHLSSQNVKLGAKLRAARSIVMALGLFTICWGPYYTTLFCFVLFKTTTTPITEFALLWIATSNSYMNFFVFLGTYRSFRKHFLVMMRCGRKNPHSEISTVSTS